MTTEERLEKIERELAAAKRRNRWMIAAGCLAVAWIFTVVYGDKTEIRARRFVVVGEGGRLRGSLYASGLSLFDENGKSRIALSADKDDQGLSLWDKNGKFIWSTP